MALLLLYRLLQIIIKVNSKIMLKIINNNLVFMPRTKYSTNNIYLLFFSSFIHHFDDDRVAATRRAGLVISRCVTLLRKPQSKLEIYQGDINNGVKLITAVSASVRRLRIRRRTVSSLLVTHLFDGNLNLLFF
ncbi:unnamed protein product [Chrysodeixis includens]|uniref:Uncharacterized protein n=1 Tax=Chrysodeixis includens TaxID=689277 RepID=A0A9N8Q0M9_CHRIL|nr:unnamed protein product [Chrysodeixis includens]